MPARSFAQTLKDARQQAGQSQAALALAAGLTAPYVSLLESGRRRPPRPPVIERLAEALGVPPAPLLETAALERTPGDIRQRLEGMDRERSRVATARDRVLSTTLFHLSRNPEAIADLVHGGEPTSWLRSAWGRVGGDYRRVTNAREARARSSELLQPLPAAERDRLLDALPEVLGEAGAAPEAPLEAPATLRIEVRARPESGAPVLDQQHVDARGLSAASFGWRLEGDDAYPRLEAGDVLVIDPSRAAREGDLVALVHDGRGQVRRLARRTAEEVRLEGLRPEVPPLRLAPARFVSAGVVVRVLRTLV